MSQQRITRRRFVQNTLATAAAAAAVARPRLLRAAGKVSANGKLNVAFIGTEHQALSDFDQIMKSNKVHVAALCDLDEKFLDKALVTSQASDVRLFDRP